MQLYNYLWTFVNNYRARFLQINFTARDESGEPPRSSTDCGFFVLTLHNRIHFHKRQKWGKWLEISYIYYWPTARTLTSYYNRHMKILLSLLFCLNIALFHCYQRINIFLRGAPLRSWVNPVHFKGGHVEPMKHTWWNRHGNWDCSLEHYIYVTEIRLFWVITEIYMSYEIYMKNIKCLSFFAHIIRYLFLDYLFWYFCEISTWIWPWITQWGLFSATYILRGFWYHMNFQLGWVHSWFLPVLVYCYFFSSSEICQHFRRLV